jgi:hypothetical protein
MISAPSDPRARAPGRTASPLAAPRWAKVEKIRLIRREVRETLGIGAIDLLLARADVVIEGDRAPTHDGRVYATFMITIDLKRCIADVRDPADAATAERLAELLADADVLRDRMLRMATAHLSSIAARAEDELEISLEISVRHDGTRVLVDGDAVASRPGTTRRRRRTDER